MINDRTITDRYALYNADTMQVLPTLPSESIGFSVYSPPFPELYQYSSDPRDMSNCASYAEGMEQYRYVVEQIYRLTKPGRITAVHCMDLRIAQFNYNDFPGDITKMHQEAGFSYFGRVTIWKDPWLVARRTRLRSLMHKLIVNDSSQVKPAGADYVLIFKKPGDGDPIAHPEGLRKYAGEEPIPPELWAEFKDFKGDQRTNRLSHWIWRRYASPVWMDIRPGRLLPYEEARENEEEKHVCPLQLDVIERLLTLYSNKGDTVLTPFLGVGSEAYMAVCMGRRAIGNELKETYYRQACSNVENASENDNEAQQMIEFHEEPQEQDSADQLTTEEVA